MTFTKLTVGKGELLYSTHANLRMKERAIIKLEVAYILTNGFHEARKDQFNEEHSVWDYAIKGKTLDGRTLRVVVTIVDPEVLIVTAIDLDK